MGNSFLLIVAGLLLFYLVVSDKWKCIEGFAGCVTGKAGNGITQNNVSFPNLPPLQTQPRFQPNPATLGLQDLALNTNWATYGF